MNAIEIREVSKAYRTGLFRKKVAAVQNLSLAVTEGEVFGLIGPNGAGKSSTIRMLLGLSRPDSGSIFLNGDDVRKKTVSKYIGYLPENPYLYDHLNILELFKFCAVSSSMDSFSLKDRQSYLLDKLNLQNVAKRPLRTFSKGMLQRAAIGFSLLHDPSIIIFDEPMSGLDPLGRKMIFDLVLDLKKAGKTIFFCSHILNDVERICDHIALLNNGKLVKEFSQSEFKSNPDASCFLYIKDPGPDLLTSLQSRNIPYRKELDGYLLAVNSAQYRDLNSFLQSNKVNVIESRSEWLSLEDLFMQGVGEGEQ